MHNNNTKPIESDHLDGRVDMYRVLKTLILEQRNREKEGRSDFRLPFRPDHGHKMMDDKNKVSESVSEALI